MIDRSRTKLPREAYFALQKELETLKNEGVLTPERFAELSERYAAPDAKLNEKENDFSVRVSIAATTLGVLTFGIAAFLLLRFYWADFSENAKTAIVCGATAFSYVGVAVSRRFGKTTLAETFALVGSLAFGLAVWQITVLYRIDISTPRLLYYWGFGVFLLAFFSRRSTLHFLAVAIFASALADGVYEFMFDSPTFNADDLGPKAALFLLFVSAIGYFWGVRRNFATVSILYLILASFWAFVQPGVWACRSADLFNVFWGGLVWFFGVRFIRNRAVGRTARILGAGFVFFFLTQATFDTTVYRFFFETESDFQYYFIVLALVASGAGVVAFRKARSRTIRLRSILLRNVFSPAGTALLAFVAFAALYACVLCACNSNERSNSSFLKNEIFFWGPFYLNALAVGLAWFFIVSGANGKPVRYWVGCAYFLVWLGGRYFRLFGSNGGSLSAVPFFTGVAIALFAAAFFFRKNNRLRLARSTSISIPGADAEEPDVEPAPREPNPRFLRIGWNATILLQFAALFGVVAVERAAFNSAQTIFVEARPCYSSNSFPTDDDFIRFRYSLPILKGEIFDPISSCLDETKRCDASELWCSDNQP